MKVLSILIIVISFSQCGSVNFEKNPPFEITSAVYENWIGGQPGIRGTNVKINYIANTDFEFNSVYFSNKVTKLQTKKAISGKLVIGYFNTSTRQNDIVLDENPTKELNNPVPNLKKFPFALKEDEAVISYIINNKTEYYKLKLVNKEQSISIPRATKQ